jgi:murein DD-endopeptidase MepM/ murein hydrolase activator NlpD
MAIIALVASGTPAYAGVWAVTTPAKVDPGGVFEAKAQDTANAGATATVRFAGHTTPMMPLRGVLRALVAVPASTKPGTYPVVITVKGHAEMKKSVTVRYKYFPSQNIHMKPSKTGLMDQGILDKERAILSKAYARHTAEPLWTQGFVVPANGPHTSAWGRRRTVNGRHWGQHQGADIAAGTGVTVKATNTGVVAVAQKLWMRGNTVVIDHGFGVFSMYNHLSRIDVKAGERVGRGERIGLVGATGFVTGPHLHWEMRVGPVSVNPWPIVKYGLPLG